MNSRLLLLALLVLLAALGLSACGNKGPLVRPGAEPRTHHAVSVSAPAPAATSALPSSPAAAATASPRG
ncbi:lipoprotein [Metallibacterium sp.]|uniref:LPS translocon maturation chaperone LptM n=1 Tax=Metallibacterium sp. TaxID=2940281 RepID=UPI002606534A|nr:lipoprotein [Metallibacterium sp.]